MTRTQTVTDQTRRAFNHVDAAFAHADQAFKHADRAFAAADKLFDNLPHGEHTKTETGSSVEHTLRFTAPGIRERFRVAGKFFRLGFKLLWHGTGNLCFRSRK